MNTAAPAIASSHSDWTAPRLRSPNLVLGATGRTSKGFAEQLVLQAPVTLSLARKAEAFEAAAATGTLTALVTHPTGPKGASELTLGHAVVGNAMHTGSPEVDAWERSNLQPDLTDVVDTYEELGELHFAPNVLGLVQGESAYLPVLTHGAVGEAPKADVLKGLVNLGNDWYAKAGLPAASLEQALQSASLLSSRAGHAFAVTSILDGGSTNYVVSPLMQLTTTQQWTRAPEPIVTHAVAGLQLMPASTFTGPVSDSLVAVVQGTKLAVAPKRHAAIGDTPAALPA